MNCNKGIKLKNPVLIIVLDFSALVLNYNLKNLIIAISIINVD